MTLRTDTPDNDIAKMIIAMERAALDRWGNGDPSGFLEICAPEVVYFDPHLERRIDGLDILTQYYEAIRGKVFTERYELLNPLVQLVDNAAVLTFNYVSYSKDEDRNRWNCTEVYKQTDEGWKIIQTHWSYTLAARA